MLSDFAGILTHKLLDLVSGAYPNIVVVAAICTALTLFSSQACNPGKVWWRSRDLLIDACYWLTIQIIGPYIRTGLLVAFATVIMCFTSADALNSYIDHGKGPIGAASDRKSTRLNSSHSSISYAVFCLKKKKKK